MTKDNKTEDSFGIPGMNLRNNYSPKNAQLPENPAKLQKDFEKTRKDFEKIKGTLVKKHPFIQAIGIISPQAVKLFVEDELGENVAPAELEKLQKKIHLYVIVPEEQFKNIPKIKSEIVAELDKAKQNAWVYVKTPVDIWETCMDSKFDMVSAIGVSFPIYDTGILAALRVAEIHKSLVLQKFDKYVVSYVIGGSLIRGNVTPESDVDCFVLINDTDVKQMPRLELKERLRKMIYKYIAEANALAGIKKNILNIQVWLLTDFWESVKDAHPVIFTFIRDGVPLHDKGTFLPWKALLRMGRLKPSPEAIDMFMKTAEKTEEMIERRLLDAMVDLYYKVLNPSQALIMLAGSPPPTHKETPKLMKDIFVTKEKLLKASEVVVLKKLVEMFRSYEHNPKMTIKGAEIDQLIKDSDAYIKRLLALRGQIEKRAQEKTLEQLHFDITKLLEAIVGKKAQATMIKEFEDKFVKKGKFTHQHLRTLQNLIKIKAQAKKKQVEGQKFDEVRKNSAILVNDLIEYSQRSDLVSLERTRMRLKYKKAGKAMMAEILYTPSASFLFTEDGIKKITTKIENSDMKEVSAAVSQQKEDKTIEINPKVFDLVKKELGSFEITL